MDVNYAKHVNIGALKQKKRGYPLNLMLFLYLKPRPTSLL